MPWEVSSQRGVASVRFNFGGQQNGHVGYRELEIVGAASGGVLPIGTAVQIASGASLDLNGVTQTIGSLADPGGENMGLLFRGGTLQYTGSTAQSTNRAIRISTVGGATIDASGSNPAATLSFTAASSPNFFEFPGNRSLTLTGTNTGDNTFAMAIQNAGGRTSLTKNGTGSWILSGANDHSGITSLNAGTLRITTSAGLGEGGFSGDTLTNISNNAALELQGNLTINEHFHMQGAGPTGQGVLRSISGNSSLTTNFALDSDSTFGVDSGTLTISATIYHDSGAHALTKVGSGTLELSGNNTYAGNTTVSAGKLVINGNISTSALTTVASGATLGGSGTVGKAVINGILDIGNSPGQMIFTDTLALAGSTIMEVDGTAGAGVAGGHDFANLTGAGAAGVLTYGGTLTLDLGLIFGAGTYSWNLFGMASETGTFTGITLADQ